MSRTAEYSPVLDARGSNWKASLLAGIAALTLTMGSAHAKNIQQYSIQGWWRVVADQLDSGAWMCTAASNYSGTEFWMGSVHNKAGERVWAISFSNKKWKIK